jgi:hypothetical protein
MSIETIAFYSASIVTIAGAIALILRSSKKFSRFIATKIVSNADMSELNGCIGGCKFESSVKLILSRLDDLDKIKVALKRLEYLNMRNHNEDDEVSINAIYDEYKRLGGNSYIDMDYERWSNRKTVKKKAASAKRN